MEIYVASKKLAPSKLDIPNKSDKGTNLNHPRKCKSRRLTLGQATATRLPPSGRVST
jgi:hypothetical protein